MLRTARIIGLTLLGVVQCLISKQQDAHALFRVLSLINIRMILQSEFLKCCLNATGRSVWVYTQHGVIVSKSIHLKLAKQSEKRWCRVGAMSPESPLLLFLAGTSLFN